MGVLAVKSITAGSLKNWRKSVKLTQSQLAEHLGVTVGSVQHWENARHIIGPRTIQQLIALAKEWGVPGPKIREKGRVV